jgi:tetratricopeptide (TPR) repeat protein
MKSIRSFLVLALVQTIATEGAIAQQEPAKSAVPAPAASTTAQKATSNGWDKLIEEALAAAEKGNYADAKSILVKAMIEAEKRGSKDPSLAITLNSIGAMDMRLGQMEEAQKNVEKAVSLAKELPAGNSEVTYSAMTNLAEIYIHQGKLGEAEPLLKQALAMEETAKEPDTIMLGKTLNDLATLYLYQKNLKGAEDAYRKAITHAEKSDDLEFKTLSLSNLAVALLAQGKAAEAEPLAKQAVTLRESNSGANHPGLALVLNTLGNCQASQGKLADSEPVLKRAIEIQRTSFPATHPHLLVFLKDYSRILKAQKKTTQAEQVDQEIATISQSEAK